LLGVNETTAARFGLSDFELSFFDEMTRRKETPAEHFYQAKMNLQIRIASCHNFMAVLTTGGIWI
jgi:hypothetical protein